jgi:hypothetical protein
MRGYLPAVLLLLLWGLSTGSWILWNGSGPAQARAVLGRGVVLVNWGDSSLGSGFGRVTWGLGTNLTSGGAPVTWLVSRPLWATGRGSVEWLPEFYWGHVKIPVCYLAAIAAVPAAVSGWRRSRRPAPGCCSYCGYDLKGSLGGACPECGQAAGGAP